MQKLFCNNQEYKKEQLCFEIHNLNAKSKDAICSQLLKLSVLHKVE